jgi:OmpA-OmpF porin, OOP family
MSNLLDTIKDHLSQELISNAASALGESESGIAKALGSLAPTILSGILNKSGDASSMGNIFNALSKFDSGVLDKLGSLIGGGNLAQNDPKDIAGQFLGGLFGPKVPAITNAVSAFAGVKQSSTSSLLGLVGPLVMGVLSKKISTSGLNISGLANLLVGEKANILGALPTGMGSILGLADLGGSGSPTPSESAKGSNWLMPLLALAVLAAGVMYYMKNCTTKPEVVKPQDEIVAAPPPPPPPPALAFTAGTEEAGLLAFVTDAAAAIDKNKWFNFPEIQFDVNKATIKPESEAKLNAVLSVLKEFPAVKLKIGGYTDSDGNDAANLKLSADRAKSVFDWLVSKGIAAERIAEPEGYGEKHPVAANDSPENKAKNRRISFSVRAK